MNPDLKNNTREDREPTMGSGAVFLPMWIVGLLGFLIYWSCNFIDQRSGKFSQLVYEPYLSTNELDATEFHVHIDGLQIQTAQFVRGKIRLIDQLAELTAAMVDEVAAPVNQEAEESDDPHGQEDRT